MSFRHNMRGKSPQAQAIVRQRDKEEVRRKKESVERKTEDLLLKRIIVALEENKRVMDIHEISKEINESEISVLKVINDSPHDLLEGVMSETDPQHVVYRSARNS